MRSLKLLDSSDLYETVKLRYLSDLRFKFSIAHFRKIRFNIAFLNLHFGRLKFLRPVINNLFQNTHLLRLPSGRIFIIVI